MASRFTLLGAKGLEIAQASRLVGVLLGIRLEMRDSSYRDGEYFLHRYSSGTEVSVEGNVRDEEGELTEPEFPEYTALIYLNYSRVELEGALSAVEDFDLLRVEIV